MNSFDYLVGVAALVLGILLVIFALFLWITMIIDAAKNHRWLWLFAVIAFELIGTIAYMILVYKKSPVDELIIKPFRKKLSK